MCMLKEVDDVILETMPKYFMTVINWERSAKSLKLTGCERNQRRIKREQEIESKNHSE